MVWTDSARRIGSALVRLLIIASLLTATSLSAAKNDSLVIVYNNLGIIKAKHNHDWKSAENNLNAARSFAGRHPAVLNNLGNVCLCQGKVAESLKYFAMSYAADSLDRSKLYNWSIALYMADSLESAIEKMTDFLVYADSSETAQGLVALLEKDTGEVKAGTARLVYSEVKSLKERAQEEYKKKRLKKEQIDSTSDSATTRKKTNINGGESLRTVVPAGAKAADVAELASILYWMTL